MWGDIVHGTSRLKTKDSSKPFGNASSSHRTSLFIFIKMGVGGMGGGEDGGRDRTSIGVMPSKSIFAYDK
jgi:hypothetical protein